VKTRGGPSSPRHNWRGLQAHSGKALPVKAGVKIEFSHRSLH